MAKRKRLSRKASRKNFRRGAGTKSKNLLSGSSRRGGIRL